MNDFFLIWTASSEFGTYRLCEQRRFRLACSSAQSRQNLRCLLIQAVSQEEPLNRTPDPWPLWIAGHAQLKFIMTGCSKTQNSLDRAHLRMFAVTHAYAISLEYFPEQMTYSIAPFHGDLWNVSPLHIFILGMAEEICIYLYLSF